MARNQYFDQKHTPVSAWHRSKHNGIAFIDLDFLSICPACARPLFLADTIYNINNEFKGKSAWLQRPYIFVAKKCELPYFDILYLFNGNWMRSLSRRKKVAKVGDLKVYRETVEYNPSGSCYVISKKWARELSKKMCPIKMPVDDKTINLN